MPRREDHEFRKGCGALGKKKKFIYIYIIYIKYIFNDVSSEDWMCARLITF